MTPFAWLVLAVVVFVGAIVALMVWGIFRFEHVLLADRDEYAPSLTGLDARALDLSDLAPPRQTYPADAEKLRLVAPHRPIW